MSVRRRDKDLEGEGWAGSRRGERVSKEGTPTHTHTPTAVRDATLGVSEREGFGGRVKVEVVTPILVTLAYPSGVAGWGAPQRLQAGGYCVVCHSGLYRGRRGGSRR